MIVRKSLIRARAPLRISFAGGGTDVSPYTDDHGGAILSTTIDRYAYTQLTALEDDRVEMRDLDTGGVTSGKIGDELESNGHHDLAKAVVSRLKLERGFKLEMHTDVPWGSGLGSSSTHVVSVVTAFNHWLDLGLSSYRLAEIAYEIERVDLGQLGGRQDQYAASFGGFNFIEFGAGTAEVIPLRIKPQTLDELHYRLILCSLGSVRLSTEILGDQIERYEKRLGGSVEALDQTKLIAFDTRNALLKGNIDLIGQLLDDGWSQKKRFSQKISNPKIDEIYSDLRKHGAIGGKLLGAGGGGHMMFICERERKMDLVHRVQSLNLELVNFAFEPNGATAWSVN